MAQRDIPTWLFNPWDYGDAAVLFGLFVLVASLVAAPARRWMTAGPLSLIVAVVCTVIYLSGAVATAGMGPLLPLGATMLFVPAWVISLLILINVAGKRRPSVEPPTLSGWRQGDPPP